MQKDSTRLTGIDIRQLRENKFISGGYMTNQKLIDEILDVALNRDRRDPIQSLLELGKDIENMHKDPAERVGEIIHDRFVYAAGKMICKLFE